MNISVANVFTLLESQNKLLNPVKELQLNKFRALLTIRWLHWIIGRKELLLVMSWQSWAIRVKFVVRFPGRLRIQTLNVHIVGSYSHNC